MKKFKQTMQMTWIMLLCILGYSTTTVAQCVDMLGSSPNVFTTYNSNANQIIVNNDLDAVIFIHRNDPAVFPGTDNGVFRYDISTDNGATWQVNQGFLNPGSTLGVNGARYPQVGIYNPEGNKILSNASLVYHGPTNSGFDWNGYVTGSLLLDGAATSTENNNQAGVSNTLIPGGFCQGVPGTFWTVDLIYDENTGGSGLRVLEGTYSGGDVNWAVNAELTPSFNIDYFGSPAISASSVNMAFDPTGMNGWIVMLSHLDGLSDYVYHPVFYNTTDGGATWNGPVQLDLTTFGSITSQFSSPGCGFQVDIEVDANGSPHALVYVAESAGPYSVFTTSGMLYDFNYNGGSWNATPVSRVGYATRPQISRSADGNKMVFTWEESDIPSTSGYAPNLKAVTYDVPTGNISCPVNYATICPSIVDGQMYQTTVSPNMIEEGGLYTVPVVLTITDPSGDQNAPAQHYYLNELSFTDADFINVATPPTLTISASGPTKYCVGGSVDLTASSASSYLWNTGETTQTITATGGNYWVIDPAESTCISNNNSIAVTQVETPFLYPSFPAICPGGSVDIYVFSYNTPSYDSYLWTPNGETTEFITVTSGGTYDVLVDGCPSYGPVVITEPGVPANDNICGAQTLTVGTTASFNNFCSSAEPNEPVPPIGTDPTYGSCYSQDGWCDYPDIEPFVTNSVWFSFIAPATGAVQIQATNIDYYADYQLALYESSDQTCSGQLTLVAANDNDLYDWTTSTLTAYCINKGKRYFVQVDGGFGSTGEGIITVTPIPNTVTICHNGFNITVSGCALAAHLAHGDVIGDCPPAVRVSATDDEDISAISLNVYPNPSNGNMNVSFESDSEETYTMQVVDLAGRVILSETRTAVLGENEQLLDLQSVNPGLYFLTISKGENVMQTRIVKQ